MPVVIEGNISIQGNITVGDVPLPVTFLVTMNGDPLVTMTGDNLITGASN